MAELKVTLAGVEYTAPAPRVKEFKEYIKMSRLQEKDIDTEFSFIASLFRDPAVTPKTLEEVPLADGVRLQEEAWAWFSSFFPGAGKNAKSR